MSARSYLDWNATAPLRAEARAAMVAAMDVVGNPSSVHAEGRAAKAIVERARDDVAALVGCRAKEVVFTSGATEAAGVLAGFGPGGVVVQAEAHDCLLAHERPMPDGAKRAAVMAMGLANSETGVITELGDTVRERGKLSLLDIVQAVGRVPFAFSWSGADFALVSAHKIGGPKGVGALIVREGIDITSLHPGGGQEMGRRSGTENLVGIAGFGAAARTALADQEAGVWAGVAALRDRLEARILAATDGVTIAGQALTRLPNTTSIVTPGWKGETQVMQMDLSGFAVSAGSACSSGKVRTSRVLRAMGFDENAAASALRVSLGPTTTEDEVDRFAAAWIAAWARHAARAA
jgi:cysteine desulfurase